MSGALNARLKVSLALCLADISYQRRQGRELDLRGLVDGGDDKQFDQTLILLHWWPVIS